MAYTPTKLSPGAVRLEQSCSTEASSPVAVLDEERISCGFLHYTARAVPYPAGLGAGEPGPEAAWGHQGRMWQRGPLRVPRLLPRDDFAGSVD